MNRPLQNKFKFAVCIAVLLFCVRARGQETGAASPCDSLPADLRFIHEQLKENSSPYNHDVAIRERTDRVFEDVLAKAPECKTNNDYRTAIQTYVAAFHDPHLHVTRLPTVNWVSTNIWIRKLNDRYFVWNSTEEAPYGLRRGDEWLGCEGRQARDILIHDNLALQGYTVLESALYGNALNTFVRTDKAKGDKIDCDFSQDGKVVTKTLEWASFNEQSKKRVENELENRPTYSLSKEPWGYWAALSGMSSDTADELKALKSFVRDAEKLHSAKTIVLDLRANGGGNSAWGDRWIEGLFGSKPRQEEAAGSSCLLWASPENLRHFRELDAEMLKEQPLGSAYAKKAPAEIEWLSDDKKGFINYGTRKTLPKTKTRELQTLQYQERLYVLTDAKCVSSCEIFVMALRDLPGVVHVGLATNASTLYGDVRTVETPSRNARIQFPQKVFNMASLWKGRKPGEPIQPAIPLQYDPAQEARGQDSLRGAVLDLLKRDGRL